jgi:hypothetical protein
MGCRGCLARCMLKIHFDAAPRMTEARLVGTVCGTVLRTWIIGPALQRCGGCGTAGVGEAGCSDREGNMLKVFAQGWRRPFQSRRGGARGNSSQFRPGVMI